MDFVGLSFVRSAQDVARLRHELKARACRARIVVKIEKPQAVQNLEEIVAATDAVMVARGDLGVGDGRAACAIHQKRIIALCNAVHRPVITATQMLNSMEHSNRPTRAEASDVFNAVLDGSDAVMLSAKAPSASTPVEAVATMRRICDEAEGYLKSSAHTPGSESASLSGLVDPITEAAADAACLVARRLDAVLIVVVAAESAVRRWRSAIADQVPMSSRLARTEEVARLLSLCWGVEALLLPDAGLVEQALSFGVGWAKSHGLVRPGQNAVLLRGQTADRANTVAILAGEVP